MPFLLHASPANVRCSAIVAPLAQVRLDRYADLPILSQIMSGTYHIAKRRWMYAVAMWVMGGLGGPSGLDGQEALTWTIASGAVEM